MQATGEGMLEEEIKKAERSGHLSIYKSIDRKKLTLAVCLMTAALAGLTVWSINGSITLTTHHSDDYQGWYEVNTYTVDPVIQGMFAFLTVCFLFWSIILLKDTHTLDPVDKKM